MNKVIVSGGPRTGELDVIEGIRHAHPDFFYVPNPNQILRADKSTDKSYPQFGQLLLCKSLDLESQIPEQTQTALIDGSIIDTAATALFKSEQALANEARKHAEAAGYTLAFVCDYVGRSARRGVTANMKTLQNYLWSEYTSIGAKTDMEVVILGNTSPYARMKKVEKTLEKYLD